MHRSFALAAFFAAAVSATAFWFWMGRPAAMPDAPEGRLQCVSYTPYDGSGSPLDPTYTVAPAHIAADLRAISALTGCIRTYSSLGPQGDVVRIADQLGLAVHVGIWISTEDDANGEEIAAALALAAAHPKAVRSLVVGNEVMLRREMTGERLAGIIADVRARSGGLPVTYADIFEFWRRNPVLAETVDFMMVHVLPHWDDPEPVTIDAVQDHVAGILDRVRATFPNARFMIGEIGWPSAGRTRGGSVPSRVNQARFIREFVGRAESLGVPYNIIEGVDQPWKRGPEGTVGGYWGIVDASRALKFPLTGPVAEWPRWREALAATLAIAALTVAWGLRPRRRLSPARWIGLGLAGAAFGATLVVQADRAATVALGPFGWVHAAAMALLTVAAFALVALPRLDSAPSPWRDAVPAGVDALLAARRRPRDLLAPDRALGLLAWATLLFAAITAVLFAIDGRHRDFPIPGLWLPVAALLVHRLATGGGAAWVRDRREEGWLALLAAVAGLFAWDGTHDVEAMAWMALAAAAAAPWLPAGLAAIQADRAQQPEHDRECARIGVVED